MRESRAHNNTTAGTVLVQYYSDSNVNLIFNLQLIVVVTRTVHVVRECCCLKSPEGKMPLQIC